MSTLRTPINVFDSDFHVEGTFSARRVTIADDVFERRHLTAALNRTRGCANATQRATNQNLAIFDQRLMVVNRPIQVLDCIFAYGASGQAAGRTDTLEIENTGVGVGSLVVDDTFVAFTPYPIDVSGFEFLDRGDELRARRTGGTGSGASAAACMVFLTYVELEI